VEVPNDGLTVILLTHPGAPARHLKLPRAWPAFLGAFSMLSIFGSLAVGRQARALCEADPAPLAGPAASAESEDQLAAEQAVLGELRAKLLVSAAPAGLRATGPTRVPARQPLSAGMPRTGEAPFNSGSSRPLTDTAKPTPESTARPLLSGKVLSLFDVNAGQALKVVPFDQEGVADPSAFNQLRTFLRCRRSGHEMDMDPKLIALLSRISQHFDGATLQVISGHRKPDGKVTRETSQHAFGTATDIRIAGVSIEALRDAAQGLGAKGVGLYTKGQFVHVDVRERAYSWRDRGEETEAGLELAGSLPANPSEEPAAADAP
jgi:uncharacterized protein YcbK (DUF882 family)